MNLKIKKKKFKIRFIDGLNFSKRSGDRNPIHINKDYGYNSIFGQNIVHGVLPVIFFLNTILNAKKVNISELKINFLKPINYNENLHIKQIKKKKNRYNFLLNQNKELKIEIDINLSHKNISQNLEAKQELILILKKISWYVGMKYPGENSLLTDILIKKNQDVNIVKKIKFNSKLLDKRLPIIKNKSLYKNYLISFTSLIRPKVKYKKTRPNLLLLKTVKKIKDNVLIIGASQGIGRDLLNLLMNNKDIKIIATYYRNKILIKKKNVIIEKFDVSKNLKDINTLIEKFSPIKIFYFATSKISFKKKLSKDQIADYENYFLKFPLKIIKMNLQKKISFFYPSTNFINFDKDSPYSMIKLKAEKKIKKFCDQNNVKFKYHRFPAINSRQSISISNLDAPNLNDYFNKDKKVITKILL